MAPIRPLSLRLAPALAGLAVLAACSGPAPALPPVPLVEGPLAPRIVYPPAGAELPAGGRHAVYGSLGSGRAALSIDGHAVPVLPNGSFLAHLPTPRPGSPGYEVRAVLGGDTLRLRHPVLVRGPGARPARRGSLAVDPSTIALRRGGEERVRVSVWAPGDAAAWVELAGGGRQALFHDGIAEDAPRPGRGGRAGAPRLWAAEVPARALRGPAALRVGRGPDTLRFALPAVDTAGGGAPRWAVLGGAGRGPVAAMTAPGGASRWFLLPDTRVQVTGREGGFARVRLDARLEAWVAEGEVRLLPDGFSVPPRVARGAVVSPAGGAVELVVPLNERPPFLVEEQGDALVLTLYGTQAHGGTVHYAADDSVVRSVDWTQETSDRLRFRVQLAAAPFGYETAWERGALVLRVRRPPRVVRRAPLRGLTVAVDPGHPPHGATGPTGLREADVTLAVARRLRAVLEDRGARVVMTRTTAAPVALEARAAAARRAGAHALVSLHVDARPGEQDPRAAGGTGTYFFHPRAGALARAVQRGMVARLGLPSQGVFHRNLAVVRATWMPAVLAEGATLTVPEHEAALRTPEFQARYARGVADGLEAYFRDLAEAGR